MHEEVNREVVTLVIRGGKISGEILKKAMIKALSEAEKQKKKYSNMRKQKAIENKPGKKTTLRKLINSGTQITNIEVTEKNIKSFEKVARKYDIDYGLKKIRQRRHQSITYFLRRKM